MVSGIDRFRGGEGTDWKWRRETGEGKVVGLAGGHKGNSDWRWTLYGNGDNADGKANGMNGEKAAWTVE